MDLDRSQWGEAHNRALKGVEYIAKYNLGHDAPYTAYRNSDVTQPTISSAGRGDTRPVWELFYSHYVVLKGLDAPYLRTAESGVGREPALPAASPRRYARD